MKLLSLSILGIILLSCFTMAYNVNDDYIYVYHEGDFSLVPLSKLSYLSNPFVSEWYKLYILDNSRICIEPFMLR